MVVGWVGFEVGVSLRGISGIDTLLALGLRGTSCRTEMRGALGACHRGTGVPKFHPNVIPVDLVGGRFNGSILMRRISGVVRRGMGRCVHSGGIGVLNVPLPGRRGVGPVSFSARRSFRFIFSVTLTPRFATRVSTTSAISCCAVRISSRLVRRRIGVCARHTTGCSGMRRCRSGSVVGNLLTRLSRGKGAGRNNVRMRNTMVVPTCVGGSRRGAVFGNTGMGSILMFGPTMTFSGGRTRLSSLLGVGGRRITNIGNGFDFRIRRVAHVIPTRLGRRLFSGMFNRNAMDDRRRFHTGVGRKVTGRFRSSDSCGFLVSIHRCLIGGVNGLRFPSTLLGHVVLLGGRRGNRTFITRGCSGDVRRLA